MNKISIALLMLAACGLSSSDNESVGQVKKVVKKTPLVCPDYAEIDISLGVMRNGVGSMSHEDMVLAIDNSEKTTIDMLKRAAESGSIVKFTYDVKRISPCWPDHRLDPTVVVEVTPAAPTEKP